MPEPKYDDAFVQGLFDRMGPTYDLVNVVSSFGFSELWRWQCVRAIEIHAGDKVCDMMSGAGECWGYVLSRGAHVTSVDFCRTMIQRQLARAAKTQSGVDVRCENALRTSIPSESIDCVVSAFGLKTLGPEALLGFARELHRILKPGGRFSLLEISRAEGWLLAPLFRWYVDCAVPVIGKMFLGDIECYRMLGKYTTAFGSCARVADVFAEAGLEVAVRRYFFGCASALVGAKLAPVAGSAGAPKTVTSDAVRAYS